MILLIAGASHTGKTLISQKLLEKYAYPYLSLDHLKMGLIRSGNTNLTTEDDDQMTPYLWNITKEIIKTAIENKQNLIIEGVYIPFDWKDSFDSPYLQTIQYYCLIMSEPYIEKNFSKIKKYADTIEQRVDDSYCTMCSLQEDNRRHLKMCQKFDDAYILINDTYSIQKIISQIKL